MRRITGLLVLLLASAVMAQSYTQIQIRNRMQDISFLQGEWKGDGWIQLESAGRSTFDQSEKIYWKLDSTLLIVEGVGINKTEGKAPDTAHLAYAVLSWNEPDSSYHMRAYRSTGEFVDAPAELVNDSTFVWYFEIPHYVMTRYTVTVSGGNTWHEIGEHSGDGSSWTKFMEMTLRREKK